MADARAYPVDFVPGASSSDDLNKLPRGCVGGRVRDSNESDIDGIAVLIEFDFTVLEDGRRQRIIGHTGIKSVTIGDVQLRLSLNSAQVQRVNLTSLGAGNTVPGDIRQDVQLDAGDYTVQFSAGRSGAGSNLVTAVANGSNGTDGEMTLTVDDVGPAF